MGPPEICGSHDQLCWRHIRHDTISCKVNVHVLVVLRWAAKLLLGNLQDTDVYTYGILTVHWQGGSGHDLVTITVGRMASPDQGLNGGISVPVDTSDLG